MTQWQNGLTTKTGASNQEPVVERFCTLFDEMSSRHLGELGEVYHHDILFTDPFVSIQGLGALSEYLKGAYDNVTECRFTFADRIGSDRHICLPWVMKLRHKRIRRGALLTVDGLTHLTLEDDLIIHHRDYFDAGQLLYENLPLLGSAVRWLRKHAA